MKYIKKFENFKSAQPMVEPDVDVPTKPARPIKPSKPIVRPSEDPEPKAKLKKKVTESDVAKRFIKDLKESGDDIKNYIK